MNRRKTFLFSALAAVLATGAVFHERMEIGFGMIAQRLFRKTVEDRLAEFGADARGRMQPRFSKAGLSYPPDKVLIVFIKAEQRLELYAHRHGTNVFVRSYAVLAASGGLGPKLREGDYQVPEGLYALESLNPNSAYHVSLRLNYPNEFDLRKAAEEHRVNLGGDIMIHGKDVSAGCIAVGDEAAEDLFTLAADAGIQNVAILSSPIDWRTMTVVETNLTAPTWVAELYADLQERMRRLPPRSVQ